jgi:hypothetical protein
VYDYNFFNDYTECINRRVVSFKHKACVSTFAFFNSTVSLGNTLIQNEINTFYPKCTAIEKLKELLWHTYTSKDLTFYSFFSISAWNLDVARAESDPIPKEFYNCFFQ